MNALEAVDLHTFYGKSHILHGISLEVHEGEIVTLLGRNGAGKTTTLRSLVGLTPPRQGSVSVFGKTTTGLPAYRAAAAGAAAPPRMPAKVWKEKARPTRSFATWWESRA